VLSGGERTRLAVARMLLRPSNTLLMDEPTNHLDLDSKDVLLEALEDYGGTLILVSHDRYFVEKLANKIIEVGHGQALVYPGSYKEFLWSKAQAEKQAQGPVPNQTQGPRVKGQGLSQGQGTKATVAEPRRGASTSSPAPAVKAAEPSREDRKRVEADRKKKQREAEGLKKRIADLEGRIATREEEVKAIEAQIATPGFYDDRDAAKVVIDRHQTLMWEVGDLMAQWEALQEHASES
jgi:ATP-binding cassette subfamily F protein 3